jgi:hypothetical protein
MKTIQTLITLAALITSTQALAFDDADSFEATGTASAGGFSMQVDCSNLNQSDLDPLKVESQKKADQSAVQTCQTISNTLTAQRAGETTFTQKCYYTGPFQSVTHFSVTATATYSCINAQ